MTLKERFDQFEDDYLRFHLVDSPRMPRPDLCAFLLLDELQPGAQDMVGSAEHDQIWLYVDTERLADVVTDEQIRELVRCGVMYDDDTESLSMFV